MVKKLLSFFCILALLGTTQAQDTYNLDWFTGIGSNVDLTIESGDKIIWTWTSPNHTVENDPAGSSVETFNSGFLGPNGSTFEHTFTVIGSNDYYCSVHGAGSMSGTITVVADGSLSANQFEDPSEFMISPNPGQNWLKIKLPILQDDLKVEVFDVLGKRVYSSRLTKLETSIQVSNWKSGIYLVRVSNDVVTHTKRFMKQ